MISEEYVRAAYRLIYGREPEEEPVLTGHVLAYESIAEMRQAFINADEFLVSRGRSMRRGRRGSTALSGSNMRPAAAGSATATQKSS